MRKTTPGFSHLFLLLASLLLLNGLTACGDSGPGEAVIEETPDGLSLLEREFGECDEASVDDNTPQYLRKANQFERRSLNEEAFPHQFPSLGAMYPLRGSWRHSKSEIMDIVDRHIWSSENGVTKLLHYFDMVLLVNVSPRTADDPEYSSAQRMQVLVRAGSSDELQDWERIHVWPISTGVPCGQKIATFTGVYKFNPNRTYQRYYSQLFDNADMFETMFLYHVYQDGAPTGVAIHGTYETTSLGRRDSGGCIRLHRDNSRCLFETIHGQRSSRCLDGGLLSYEGRVPSFEPRFGDADPEYLSGGRLEVNGIRVLIAMFDERDDRIQ